jgi:geranylgeranyl diphosphate synthase type I
MSSKVAIKKILTEMEQLGRKACEIAKEAIIKEKFEHEPLGEAISYFMKEWRNFQHPALLAIACEAVGGEPEKTTLVGAALVLLTGAADIHDDIIDKSKVKGAKATLYGKFGEDLSILVGDALLFKGLILLSTACKDLPEKQPETVQELVKQGFFELGTAEAKETHLRRNWNVTPKEYLEIVKRKAAVAEATARIGAVIGGATPEEVEDWGTIGRIFGMLINIRDEFVDIFEVKELRNRIDNECLPLPMLYAMRNPKVKKEIIRLLKKEKLTKDDTTQIADIVLRTKEVQRFKTKIQYWIEEVTTKLNKYESRSKEVEILNKISKLTLGDL